MLTHTNNAHLPNGVLVVEFEGEEEGLAEVPGQLQVPNAVGVAAVGEDELATDLAQPPRHESKMGVRLVIEGSSKADVARWRLGFEDMDIR